MVLFWETCFNDFVFTIPSEGNCKFYYKEIFIGLCESDEEWFWLFEPFSKSTFSKHGTLISGGE